MSICIIALTLGSSWKYNHTAQAFGGVFICHTDELLGLLGYKAQISDGRHDNTWFEIGELIRLPKKFR